MTGSEKIGFLLMISAFGIIISPIALSEADPYHIQDSLERLQGFSLFFEQIWDAFGIYSPSDESLEYEIIGGIRYQILVEKDFFPINPDGKNHLIPGLGSIITGQKF